MKLIFHGALAKLLLKLNLILTALPRLCPQVTGKWNIQVFWQH